MNHWNSEPTLDDLLTDPVGRQLMKRDSVKPERVRACVRLARRKLRALTTREREPAD